MNVPIRANGITKLTENGYTRGATLTVHAPAIVGGTIAVGWVDSDGTFVPYLDGGLVAGESKLYNTGKGINVVANISAFATEFIIRTTDGAD